MHVWINHCNSIISINVLADFNTLYVIWVKNLDHVHSFSDVRAVGLVWMPGTLSDSVDGLSLWVLVGFRRRFEPLDGICRLVMLNRTSLSFHFMVCFH